MKLVDILAKVNGIEDGGKELADAITDIIKGKDKENIRHKNGKKEYEEIITGLASHLGLEGDNKPEGSANELKMLTDKINSLEKANTDTLAKAKKDRIAAGVSDILAKKGFKKNIDFTKKALVGMVEEGETGLLVGDVSLEDYAQKMIDEDPTVVGTKKKKETLTGSSELYTSEELDNLTDAEYEANAEKVDQSLAALE